MPHHKQRWLSALTQFLRLTLPNKLILSRQRAQWLVNTGAPCLIEYCYWGSMVNKDQRLMKVVNYKILKASPFVPVRFRLQYFTNINHIHHILCHNGPLCWTEWSGRETTVVCVYRQPMSNEYIQPVLGREEKHYIIIAVIGAELCY